MKILVWIVKRLVQTIHIAIWSNYGRRSLHEEMCERGFDSFDSFIKSVHKNDQIVFWTDLEAWTHYSNMTRRGSGIPEY